LFAQPLADELPSRRMDFVAGSSCSNCCCWCCCCYASGPVPELRAANVVAEAIWAAEAWTDALNSDEEIRADCCRATDPAPEHLAETLELEVNVATGSA
jgi:hypothetical protein